GKATNLTMGTDSSAAPDTTRTIRASSTDNNSGSAHALQTFSVSQSISAAGAVSTTGSIIDYATSSGNDDWNSITDGSATTNHTDILGNISTHTVEQDGSHARDYGQGTYNSWATGTTILNANGTTTTSGQSSSQGTSTGESSENATSHTL